MKNKSINKKIVIFFFKEKEKGKENTSIVERAANFFLPINFCSYLIYIFQFKRIVCMYVYFSITKNGSKWI